MQVIIVGVAIGICTGTQQHECEPQKIISY